MRTCDKTRSWRRWRCAGSREGPDRGHVPSALGAEADINAGDLEQQVLPGRLGFLQGRGPDAEQKLAASDDLGTV